MAKKLVLLETMAFNTSDENVYTYSSSDGWKQYVNQGKPGEGDGSSSGNPTDSLLELDSAGAITTKNGTKNIVPNNNMEGNIGTSSKKWAKVNAGEIVSAKVITNELIADKISGKVAAETVSKIEQNGTDLTVTYANGNKEIFTVSGAVDLTDYLKSADADTKFALVNHDHDLSAYALKDDIKDIVNKTSADASAAKTTAEQAAQNAQDAKTKAESVETIANDAKTKAEAAETKANAAKTIAETAKATAEAAQIDFATPEEVLTAMTTTDIVEEPTKESTE